MAILAVGIVVMRTRLKAKVKDLSETLSSIPSYSKCYGGISAGIPADLENRFKDEIISATQEETFIDHYAPHIQEAQLLQLLGSG